MDNNNNIDIKKRDKIRIVKYIIITIIASAVSSLALWVFVYPAGFVPLGLEAVVTMLYEIFEHKVSAGVINLVLNAPLIIYALIKVDKKFVIFTLSFTLCSSIVLMLFESLNFPQYIPAEVGEGKIISAVFAGCLLGVRTGLMLRIGASSGGVDIVARIIQPKMPNINIERIITFVCLLLIGSSYFVYKDFNCILLGLIQMFISEKTTTFLMKDARNAVEVKIITKHPEQIREEIVVNLRHSATILHSKGMYSGEDNSVVLCVLNIYQMKDFINIIKKYPQTFVYYSDVAGVYGNFRRYKDEVVK